VVLSTVIFETVLSVLPSFTSTIISSTFAFSDIVCVGVVTSVVGFDVGVGVFSGVVSGVDAVTASVLVLSTAAPCAVPVAAYGDT
jgi:hypothetical protein